MDDGRGGRGGRGWAVTVSEWLWLVDHPSP
jgi:hypothetical protein